MFDLQSLPWLRKAPNDLSQQFKSLRSEIRDPVAYSKKIKSFLNYSLDSISLQLLARRMGDISSDYFKSFSQIRLAIISNSTSNYIAQAIKASGLRHNLYIDVFQSDYDQVLQQILDQNSDLYSYKPDLILLQLDYRGLPLKVSCETINFKHEEILNDSINYVKLIVDNIHANSTSSIIVQTLAPPLLSTFGHFDSATEKSFLNLINLFNKQLASYSNQPGVYLLDVANIAGMVGYSRWFDPTQWYFAGLPFNQDIIPLYADHVCRLLGAIKGTSRKVLVLDLDNTIWGGTIGDDGIDGILLGTGHPVGEAYSAVQKTAKALKERGIVLAVSSKNFENPAREVFREHPEMLLKENDIAIFQVNWIDKASNIQLISSSLGLGLDSIVFMDDNPAEREQVRQALPDVTVLEMPDDPSLYAITLAQCGYFEAVTFSAEDSRRADMYQSNVKRLELQKSSYSLDDYLRSLDMIIYFEPFNEIGRMRVSQLINKSNQYNLTTRRYTEQQIKEFENDLNTFTLQIKLSDRFGDNGMISVVICETAAADPYTWNIDTWLMSCRVLGRQVEHATLNYLIENAKRSNVKFLKGLYIPTDKNEIAKEHYSKLGFTRMEESAQNIFWKLSVADYVPFNAPINILESSLPILAKDRT